MIAIITFVSHQPSTSISDSGYVLDKKLNWIAIDYSFVVSH